MQTDKIKYTLKHRKAFRIIERQLLGHNTIRGYLHDLDKIFLYMIMDYERVYKIHRGHETKFFAFGGASSHDIQDGILDCDDSNWQEKAKKLDKQGKYMYRVKDLSWWEEELPTDEEMQHGINVLKENNNMVDFIITHSPSTSELYLMSGNNLYEPDVLTNYLEDIKVTTKYKRHLFGHMHINKSINDKDICLYEQIIRLL